MVNPSPTQKLLLPPLENGDRLNRYEFERHYNAMPHLKKAELIEGVVYMAATLRFKSHGQPHGNVISWLGNYKVAIPGVELGIEPSVRLDLDNEPQPDAVLLIEEQYGGQARLSEDDYVEGAPELVAEIAASSAAIGVPEYWLTDPVAQTVMVLTLDRKAYREVGLFRQNAAIVSIEFPDLELTVRQVFATGL